MKTYRPTLKTHVVNLKRDTKDLSRDLQRLEVCGKLGSKTLLFVDVMVNVASNMSCEMSCGRIYLSSLFFTLISFCYRDATFSTLISF